MQRRNNISILFIIIVSNFIYAQSPNIYSELLLNNKNNSFPKVLIYDGPRLPITYLDYLDLGFDFISVYSLEDPINVPNRYKYILWTGISSNDAKAKWSIERSPFVSDKDHYPNRWNSRLNYYKKTYFNPLDNDNIGVIILDIEAKKTNEELEQNPPFRTGGPLNKHAAIEEYKNEMEVLYRYPLELARKNHNYYDKWSSYSDVPVERNWWGIPNKTWIQWTTDASHLNYITNKTKNGKAFDTKFSELIDFHSVSTYFFYSHETTNVNIANQYLAYLLFQLEVNQSWTDKPIFLFYTFKYQGTKERGTYISDDMVSNSIIFAFMSGADGIVLYDDSHKSTNNPKYHYLIKKLVESISSLDVYRDYFSGSDVRFFKPDNARDLFADRKPVVRGIEKNNKLLLAATNPFAKENEITNIPIYYKGKYINIKLKGKETYLKEITL